MLPHVSTGVDRGGGVIGYPLPALYEEVAFVAYHFHWPVDSILNMAHADRRRWVEEISAIHKRRNAEVEDALAVNR